MGRNKLSNVFRVVVFGTTCTVIVETTALVLTWRRVASDVTILKKLKMNTGTSYTTLLWRDGMSLVPVPNVINHLPLGGRAQARPVYASTRLRGQVPVTGETKRHEMGRWNNKMGGRFTWADGDNCLITRWAATLQAWI